MTGVGAGGAHSLTTLSDCAHRRPFVRISSTPPIIFSIQPHNMGITAVLSRHPRYSTLLVLVLFAVTFLLYPSHQSMTGPDITAMRPFTAHGRLKQYLAQEEQYYNQNLADREALVRKWGPTASQVKSYEYPFIHTSVIQPHFISPPASHPKMTFTHFVCSPTDSSHLPAHSPRLIFSGDFFLPSFQCPHRVERIGTMGDGGKWVCGIDRIAKQNQCVVYSFGNPLSLLLLYPSI